MGVNQVKFGDTTVMDISDSTVTPETLLNGVTAYNKAGNKIIGDMVVEHVEVEPVLETGTKSATITVGEESADIYCENTKAEVKNMKTTQSATITNGIAQFECIDKNFVKSLKLTMEPIQDLHGYDYPWVGGAGKNKFVPWNYTAGGLSWVNDNNKLVITVNSTNVYVMTKVFKKSLGEMEQEGIIVNGHTYTAKQNGENQGGLKLQLSNGVGGGISDLLNGYTFTYNSSTMSAYTFVIRKYGDVTAGDVITFYPQLEEGSTATDWTPYENICPISGRTEASVKRTGKNIFNINGDTSFIYNNISIANDKIVISSIGSGATSRVYFSNEYREGTYTISAKANGAINNIRFFSPKQFDGSVYNAYYGGYFKQVDNSITVTFTEAFTIGFIAVGIAGDSGEIYDIQLEEGSIATEYEPYTAETHTHQYSETIYSGTDDFVNGGATSEQGKLVLNGTENWATDTGRNGVYYIFNTMAFSTYANCVCDRFKTIHSNAEIASLGIAFGIQNKAIYIPRLFDGAINGVTDVATWKTYLSNNNMEITYPLSTPTTISTTAEKITTVPGVNVISATEPISECSYRVLEENLSDTIYSNETLVGEDSGVYTLRTATDISDANYVEENIVGGSVAFNQLIQNGNFANTDNWSGLRGTLAAANGILTFTYTDVSDRNVVYQTIPKIKSGHKYFMSCDYKPRYNHSMQMGVELNGGSYITKTFSTIGSMWKKLTGIINGDGNGQTTFSIIVRPSGGSYAANNTDQIKNVIFVDLTLMFGSAVADYIYNLENTTAGTGIAFLQRYGFLIKDYYDYNAGSLLSVNFNKWFKTSKNLFNPNRLHHIPNYDNIIDGNDIYIAMEKYTYACLHDIGSYIPGNGRTYTLQFDPPSDITWTYASVRCRLKDNSDFGNVGTISGWTYDAATKSYRQSFENASHVEVIGTIPDCLYCEFGIGYNDSIGDIKETGTYVKFSNIQLEVGSEATDYEPYEGYEISLDDNLDLRGLFKIVDNELVADGDIYEGDGKITRKYGIVDLGTMDWKKGTSVFYTNKYLNTKLNTSGVIPNIICSCYITTSYSNIITTPQAISIDINNGAVLCNDSSYTDATTLKTAMSGVILQYELAEPILNRETNFDSPQVFIPGGNEYFVKTYTSTPDRDIDIPAGHVGKYYGKSMFKEISLPTIPKSGGTYILKCNVLADGNKKLYWCADSD